MNFDSLRKNSSLPLESLWFTSTVCSWSVIHAILSSYSHGYARLQLQLPREMQPFWQLPNTALEHAIIWDDKSSLVLYTRAFFIFWWGCNDFSSWLRIKWLLILLRWSVRGSLRRCM